MTYIQKSKYCLFIVLIFSLISFEAKTQNIINDTILCKKIIQSFQQKNIKSYLKLLISKEDYNNEMANDLRKDTIHKNPNYMNQEADKIYKDGGIKKLNISIFNQILDQGKKIGISNWGEIEFKNFFNYKISNDGKNKTFVGDVEFTFLDIKYYIYGVTIYKLRNGFKLLYCMGLSKYESFERERLRHKIISSQSLSLQH